MEYDTMICTKETQDVEIIMIHHLTLDHKESLSFRKTTLFKFENYEDAIIEYNKLEEAELSSEKPFEKNGGYALIVDYFSSNEPIKNFNEWRLEKESNGWYCAFQE